MAIAEEVTPESIWQPIDGVIESEVSKEMVLFHPIEMSYYGLNTTGVAVWQRLNGENTVREIIDELAHNTGGEPRVVRADVLNFLKELASLQFIVWNQA
jgi:hypothetical protein